MQRDKYNVLAFLCTTEYGRCHRCVHENINAVWDWVILKHANLAFLEHSTIRSHNISSAGIHVWFSWNGVLKNGSHKINHHKKKHAPYRLPLRESSHECDKVVSQYQCQYMSWYAMTHSGDFGPICLGQWPPWYGTTAVTFTPLLVRREHWRLTPFCFFQWRRSQPDKHNIRGCIVGGEVILSITWSTKLKIGDFHQRNSSCRCAVILVCRMSPETPTSWFWWIDS